MTDTATLSDLIEAVPMPMLVIDTQARIRLINAPAREIFGPAQSKHYLTVIRQPEPVAILERVLAGEAGGEVTWRATGPGQDTIYKGQVRPIAGMGASLAFEDVSALEQIVDMRRGFVANVSHELRTPLTAMLGFIETLQGAAKDDPVARDRFLSIMSREALRMNRLVGDLLSLSRVEAEERVRPKAPLNFAQLAGSVVTTLRGMADAAGVELKLSIPETLPPVPGDMDQLTQVLHNILENAIKYGGAGKRVDLQLTPISYDPVLRGPGVSLLVEDFGDGIDAVHIPRLTERFYRADSHRSREKGGTGLGLAIVKHILNRHRGRLKITSEKGKGSRFEVILPLE